MSLYFIVKIRLNAKKNWASEKSHHSAGGTSGSLYIEICDIIVGLVELPFRLFRSSDEKL